MSDYFARLAGRALESVIPLQPRVRSLFEPLGPRSGGLFPAKKELGAADIPGPPTMLDMGPRRAHLLEPHIADPATPSRPALPDLHPRPPVSGHRDAILPVGADYAPAVPAAGPQRAPILAGRAEAATIQEDVGDVPAVPLAQPMPAKRVEPRVAPPMRQTPPASQVVGALRGAGDRPFPPRGRQPAVETPGRPGAITVGSNPPVTTVLPRRPEVADAAPSPPPRVVPILASEVVPQRSSAAPVPGILAGSPFANSTAALAFPQKASSRPVINVTIGRIEVRAVSPPPEVRPKRPEEPRPGPVLEDYLRALNGGRR